MTLDPWGIIINLIDQLDKAEADAIRYRYLRKKICFTGNGDGTAAMHAINLPISAKFPESEHLAEGVDAAIDTAIKLKNAEVES